MAHTHTRHVRNSIKSGKPLHVVGNQKAGFRLAVEAKVGIRDASGKVTPAIEFRPFGITHRRQMDALDSGIKQFGVQPIKPKPAKASKKAEAVPAAA